MLPPFRKAALSPPKEGFSVSSRTACTGCLFHGVKNAKHSRSFSFATTIREQRLKTEQYLLIVGTFHASLQVHSENRSQWAFFLNGRPMQPTQAFKHSWRQYKSY